MTPVMLAEKRDAMRFKRAGGRVLYMPLDEILHAADVRAMPRATEPGESKS